MCISINDIFKTEYKADILIRCIYSSCHLSSNQITLISVKTILLMDLIPANTRVEDFYQIENHNNAYNYIIQQIQQKSEIDATKIQKIYSILTERLPHNIGSTQKKQVQTEIATSDIKLLEKWLTDANRNLEQSISVEDKLRTIAEAYFTFEAMKLFLLENENLSRILLNYFLLLENLPPISFAFDSKEIYHKMIMEQDTEAFSNYISEQIQSENGRISGFIYKAEQQIPH